MHMGRNRANPLHPATVPHASILLVILAPCVFVTVFGCGTAAGKSSANAAPTSGASTPLPSPGGAEVGMQSGGGGAKASAGFGDLPAPSQPGPYGHAGAASAQPVPAMSTAGSTPGPMSRSEPGSAAATPERLSGTYYGDVWSPAGIAAECQGFALEGLLYSPGGLRLPNRCAPFHPTTNNPYAVRCVDAWASYKTTFPGDTSCILPPPPELGLQIGAHPQGEAWFAQVTAGDLSGYAQPSDEWVMQPGEEETLSYRTSSSNTEARNYYRIYYRMRPGSHHMGISANADSTSEREVWLPGSTIPAQFDPLLGDTVATLGAIQRPDDNNPVTSDKPAEDAGLYYLLPAGTAIILNMHHFNFFDVPLIKEVWVNVFWESDARFPVESLASIPIDQALTLAIPAGQTLDLHYSWTISEPLRILRLLAHRHAWTPNFSAWIERAAGGAPELIYQSFDWFDVPTYRYDSLSQNPAPNPQARTDGASTGLLELKSGDALHFNCHITFTDERSARVGLPKTAREIGTLNFANEAYTSEMCALIGGTVKGKLPISADWSTSPLPSFAKQ